MSHKTSGWISGISVPTAFTTMALWLPFMFNRDYRALVSIPFMICFLAWQAFIVFDKRSWLNAAYFIGGGMNFLVIAANGFQMPIIGTMKGMVIDNAVHRPFLPGDNLLFLADRFIVPHVGIASVGDFVITLGVISCLTYNAGRFLLRKTKNMRLIVAAVLLLATFVVAQDKPSAAPALTDQQKLNLADALLNLMQAQQQLQSLTGYAQLSAKLGEAQKTFLALEQSACVTKGKEKFTLDRVQDPKTSKTDWVCRPATAEKK